MKLPQDYSQQVCYIAFGCLFLLLASYVEPPSVAQAEDMQITVSDTGMTFLPRWIHPQTGDDFSRVGDGFFRRSKDRGELCVVMPSDWSTMAESQKSKWFLETRDIIKNKIQSKLDQGIRNYEIRLFEDVNTFSYKSSDTQKHVAEFGKYALQAITETAGSLKKENNVRLDGVMSSNATSVALKNASELRTFDSVLLVDGRANLDELLAARELLGSGKLKTVNTHLDLSEIEIGTIADNRTVQKALEKYPDMQSYYLYERGRIYSTLDKLISRIWPLFHNAFMFPEKRANMGAQRITDPLSGESWPDVTLASITPKELAPTSAESIEKPAEISKREEGIRQETQTKIDQYAKNRDQIEKYADNMERVEKYALYQEQQQACEAFARQLDNDMKNANEALKQANAANQANDEEKCKRYKEELEMAQQNMKASTTAVSACRDARVPSGADSLMNARVECRPTPSPRRPSCAGYPPCREAGPTDPECMGTGGTPYEDEDGNCCCIPSGEYPQ